MQDNKMMKNIKVPDNPPGRLLFRNLFQEEQGMRDKNQFYPSRVSDIKLPIWVKEKCERLLVLQRAWIQMT